MKNRILTNSLHNIKSCFPRFLSLLIMSMLGCFVFVGLSSTEPDMMNTLDKYLKDYNTYDIKLISSKGLSKNDVDYIKSIKGIKDVEGSYQKDVLINLKDKVVISITSIPKDINKLELTSGVYPSKNNEILVEDNMLKSNDLSIGDALIIDDEAFSNKEFKIVGTINSSLYFNSIKTTPNRGKTSIGTGEINYYTYVLDTNFKLFITKCFIIYY